MWRNEHPDHMTLYNKDSHVEPSPRFAELPDGIESVVFLCPWVESVPDGWLSNNRSLKRVHFADLSSLTTIGHDWMSGCSELVSVNFSGLSSLTTVSNHWMQDCPSLVSLDFRGLSNLHDVGDGIVGVTC